ncbi:hypothetical protein EO244_15035 [Ancylomarina salipaludis]|uniref:DUF4493 domain-containing protein n=1 Tax=Ancylomarina salipaludis TaxID=2501299 RepID=A0A4Q1JIF5_9BACT|nr:hypothetical protein [Ancylomarina salipaludis]RXQ88840.1 hypothetical protein EO244_15035 [Ancylomarina salipaludis]
MKKLLFIVVIIITMFTACSEDKDAEIKPEVKLNKVSFTTNTLSSNVTETKSGVVLPIYDYLLFKQDGTFVKTIQFTTGTIADELPAGDYTVTLIGHDYDRATFSTAGDYIDCYWNLGFASISYTGIFKGKVDFTIVDNESSAVAIDLTRISCALALNLTDVQEGYIEVELQNMPFCYWMGMRGAEGAYRFSYSEGAQGSSQFLAPQLVNDSPYLATVKLSLYQNSTLVKVKTVNDVPLKANCTTTITGEFLKDDATTTKNSVFDIVVNEDWEDPITVNI